MQTSENMRSEKRIIFNKEARMVWNVGTQWIGYSGTPSGWPAPPLALRVPYAALARRPYPLRAWQRPTWQHFW